MNRAALLELAALSTYLTAGSNFTPEAVCNGHVPQLELVRARERNVLGLCSRRAGKSTGLCELSADDHQGAQIFFGPTKPAVRMSIWAGIWLPFCTAWRLPVDHNDTRMVTTFDDGNIIAFTGTDDLRHVETYLGNKLWRAIVDEAQSQPDSVLVPLVERILPPALSDAAKRGGGQLILAGTIPEVPAGLFYRLWLHGKGWRKLNWSRLDNPHMGSRDEQLRVLDEYLLTSGRDINDPLVRRDWFGEFVFDADDRAYRYVDERNGYDSLDGVKLDRFSVGIDPGAHDRTAITVIGWSSDHRDVYQVAEWVTGTDAQTTWSQIGEQLKAIRQRWRPSWYFYDAGGSKMTLDVFARDFGIPVVAAARKTDLAGQVSRLNDLLVAGRFKVQRGSALETDFVRTQWDKDARARGLWRWSSHNHPDVADSCRYALQAYFDAYREPAPTKRVVDPFDIEMARAAAEASLPYHKRRLREVSR
jgi:hypothetical protein